MQEYDISLDNYVKGNLSICREERQYALYLSNILRYYGKTDRRKELAQEVEEKYQKVKEIFKICGFDENDRFEDLEIENVFYEVTFMRDFLERSRRINFTGQDMDINEENEKKKRNEIIAVNCLKKDFKPSAYKYKNSDSFNEKLIEYVLDNYSEDKLEIKYDEQKVEERNYGHNAIPIFDDENKSENKEHIEKIKLLITAMMNAKPDLAVIYSYGEISKYLLFLECKFESKEDNYFIKPNEEGVKKRILTYSQRQVQWHIANFLIENQFLKYGDSDQKLKLSPKMEGKNSVLVEFSRLSQDKTILIDDLIKIESTIFNKGINEAVLWQTV